MHYILPCEWHVHADEAGSCGQGRNKVAVARGFQRSRPGHDICSIICSIIIGYLLFINYILFNIIY